MSPLSSGIIFSACDWSFLTTSDVVDEVLTGEFDFEKWSKPLQAKYRNPEDG